MEAPLSSGSRSPDARLARGGTRISHPQPSNRRHRTRGTARPAHVLRACVRAGIWGKFESFVIVDNDVDVAIRGGDLQAVARGFGTGRAQRLAGRDREPAAAQCSRHADPCGSAGAVCRCHGSTGDAGEASPRIRRRRLERLTAYGLWRGHVHCWQPDLGGNHDSIRASRSQSIYA